MAKQPWEKTREEYWIGLESSDTTAAANRFSIHDRAGFRREIEVFRAARYEEHRKHVRRAIREGKPVPTHVLLDYAGPGRWGEAMYHSAKAMSRR